MLNLIDVLLAGDGLLLSRIPDILREAVISLLSPMNCGKTHRIVAITANRRTRRTVRVACVTRRAQG